ncbi:MAG: HAD family hydrolase [Candidatus Aenigmarchaeota archaeon]|nr:HAD family hydrolase [Candidatus Aenigmarchaeota archaeon]
MSNSSISIVVFDADGTIFDSMPFYTKLFSSMLNAAYGIPLAESSAYYNSSAGMLLNKQFEAILTMYKKPTDAIQNLVDEFFKKASKKIPDIFEDVKSSLKALSDYTIFISTGTRQDMLDKRIKRHKLNAYVEKWFGVNGFKGKEDHFNEISKIYNFSGKEFRKSVVFVGDGASDMKLARKLGILGIGRTGTVDAKSLKMAGARYTVNSLSEVKEILESIT